jgi:hypothetical protein
MLVTVYAMGEGGSVKRDDERERTPGLVVVVAVEMVALYIRYSMTPGGRYPITEFPIPPHTPHHTSMLPVLRT